MNDYKGVEIEAHSPGGWWAKIHGLSRVGTWHFLVFVLIGSGYGLAYAAYKKNDENTVVINALLAKQTEMISKMSQVIKFQGEAQERQRNYQSAVIEALREGNWLMTRTEKELMSMRPYLEAPASVRSKLPHSMLR